MEDRVNSHHVGSAREYLISRVRRFGWVQERGTDLAVESLNLFHGFKIRRYATMYSENSTPIGHWNQTVVVRGVKVTVS